YYYDFAMAAPIMSGVNEKDALDILILGNGTGTFATQCERYFDKYLNITGVEIDDKITKLAKEYFELPEDIEVITYDGRAYLNAIDKKYDVIMVDAYQDITIPFQMSSIEFFTLVKDHLKDDGVMVVNMNMKSNAEGGINDYLSDTICQVFSESYYADTSALGNREFFASNNPEMLDVFAKNIEMEEDESLLFMMNRVSDRLTDYEAGDLVMTDDKAPVELLGMKVIDEIIQTELAYYKGVFKEGGIKAVMENL
ncbi:MAG: fused MFS/spermidine synthase, partial [Lachnospiraceae bacterium]|nr:fused MFS/spermidine synthase [Lachnospiraceae bacterium]